MNQATKAINPKLRVYGAFAEREELRDASVIEWVWPDGRTIQVYIHQENTVCIRTWPKDPVELYAKDEPFNETTSIYFDMYKSGIRNIRIDPRNL